LEYDLGVKNSENSKIELSILVSVIVPMFNLSSYLEACIDSLLRQTYTNIELILVDDGSTDDTLKIAQSYAEMDERIIVLNKENGGVSSARNVGLEYAKGEYCFFVDGDDLLELDTIETMIKIIASNSADILITGYYRNDSRIHLPFEFEEFVDEKKVIFTRMIDPKFKYGTALWNKIFRTSLFKNGLKFDTQLHIGEDMDVIIQCVIEAERIVVADIAGYHYQTREGSAVSSFSPRMVTIISAYNKAELYMRKQHIDSEVIRQYRIRCAISCYDYLLKALKSGYKEKSIIMKFQKEIRDNRVFLKKKGVGKGARRFLLEPLSYSFIFYRMLSFIYCFRKKFLA
jgi:glycosyltransferase involved in cell wall biosynthesis